MTKDQVMAELEALGNEKVRAINAKNGANDNQFGVKTGDLRALANKIKTNHELGLELWATNNWDARMLSTLLLKPKQLSAEDIDRMVREVHPSKTALMSHLADWVMTNIVRHHPEKEALRLKWMADGDMMAQRAGWSLTTERVLKSPDGLDLKGLLDRIEKEMGGAPKLAAWTMNFCLGEIGIKFPEHRQRVLAIGEKIGAFKDYPTPKGCVSPYVPLWVNEMVSRQGG